MMSSYPGTNMAGTASMEQFMQMIMVMSFGNGNGGNGGNGSQLAAMMRLMGMQTAMSAYGWLRTKGVDFATVNVIPALTARLPWMSPSGKSSSSVSITPVPTPASEQVCASKITTLNINGTLDAPGPHTDVVYFVCNHVPGITSMHATETGYFIKDLDGFEISQGIHCFIKHITNDVVDAKTSTATKEVEVCVRLVGKDVDIQGIQDFVSKCKALHEQDGKGLVPEKLYILDVETFNRRTTWRAFQLETFRTMNNIVLEPDQERVLTCRLDRFMNDPKSWYKRTGMPRTLGVLMHGPPGTGKTSLIKAIAMRTKRHIFNVCLGDIKTREQLNDIMFNDIITLNAKEIRVPIDERLYVMEDVDAGCRVVLSRTTEQDDDYYEEDRRITLADILNVFDGTRECPGRIIIMTTNCYDKLDDALLRPGRMDCHIHLSNIGQHALRRMLLEYCDVPAADADAYSEQLNGLENMLTPAEAACAIQGAACNVNQAIVALHEAYAEKLARVERERVKRVEREQKQREAEAKKQENEAKKALDAESLRLSNERHSILLAKERLELAEALQRRADQNDSERNVRQRVS